ncbi:AAA family ATPase, partial [Candidatus Sumerlaeota bacterium]|nr:AAA family ATPase [Candidatus Sumerlaeota bacterium]
MPKEPNRIMALSVEGYKSIFSEQRIEIRPLTLLAGANSSGKSSIMQPFLLMKQTIEAPSDPGALLLDGPHVCFTSADQILSRISRGQSKSEFTVGMELASNQRLRVTFRRRMGEGFDVARMFHHDRKEEMVLEPSMSPEDIANQIPIELRRIQAYIVQKGKKPVHWVAVRHGCFLGLDLVSASAGGMGGLLAPGFLSPGSPFMPHLERLAHLPALRGNPRRTYPRTASGPRFSGTFEAYTASIVAQWNSEKSERLTELGATLEGMGLTWKVRAQAVDDTQVELRVGRLAHGRRGGAHDLVNIADVGFGVSQVLPVVVALLAAAPGQLLYLEQPEIHLHPNAQRRLATVLRDAVRRGVVVVVETHSSLLLRAIQTLVAQDMLDRKDVKLHWFQRQEDGSTKITSADLDEAGAYGDWP